MKINHPIEFENLPVEAAEFIKLIIKKMKYRKKVRQEVMAELAGHFEDELRDCKTADERAKKTRQLIEEFGDPQLLGVLLRRAKKRCRSLWRTVIARTFQATGVLILLFIVYVGWFLSGKPEITVDYVAQLNKMVHPAVDENLNAAPYYHKAVEIGQKISEKDSELLCKKYFETTAEEKQKIAKILADNNEMLELVTEGTQKPYYWEKYRGNKSNAVIALLLPNLSDYRKMAYALRWQAMLESEHRQYEKAFYDLLISYKFGEHIRSCPTVIEQLVGIAMQALSLDGIRQILSCYQIDAATLAKLQNNMEQLISKQNFTINFSGEKLCLYDELQQSFSGPRCFSNGHVTLRLITLESAMENSTGKTKSSENLISTLKRNIWTLKLLSHPDKQSTKKTGERFYNFLDEVKFKTPGQLWSEKIDIDKQIQKIVKGNLFVEFFAPSFGKAIEISYRIPIESYATMTLIAVLRYKADKGEYPDDLQELVTSGYLNQVPMDAFSDKPLVYKKTDKDFLLYSVGLNFKDDGGKIGTDKHKSKVWQKDGDAVFWPVQQ